eukprot:766915-Hanusia_phi.AAC.5
MRGAVGSEEVEEMYRTACAHQFRRLKYVGSHRLSYSKERRREKTGTRERDGHYEWFLTRAEICRLLQVVALFSLHHSLACPQEVEERPPTGAHRGLGLWRSAEHHCSRHHDRAGGSGANGLPDGAVGVACGAGPFRELVRRHAAGEL